MTRVPPHADQTERAVLATVLALPETLPELRCVVSSGDFYGDFRKRLFGALEWLDDNQESVDVVAAARRLKAIGHWKVGDAVEISDLENTPVISEPEKHARQIAALARLRRTIGECQRIAAEGYDALDRPIEFIDAAEQSLFAIAQSNIRADRLADAKDCVSEAWTVLETAAKSGKGITGTATGFDSVDRKTTGMHPGDLYIVAGRPGMGKTSYALNIATNAARNGDGAAFFSLEMPREQLAAKMLAVEGRVDVSRLRSGNMRPDDWNRLTESAGQISRLPLKIDDTPAITLLDLRAKVRRIQTEMRQKGVTLRLVVIDYLQLMGSPPGKRSREEEVATISKGLKQLAKEARVAIMGLSQLNRSVETRSAKDKRPQLADLRESGAIEQDADAIFFVYRDEYYFKDSPDQGIAEIIVAKQRNGPTGTCKLRFQSEFTRFDNLMADEYEFNEYDDFQDFDAPAECT